MKVLILVTVVSLLVLPGWSQGVESLGVNPETGLAEIRVNLPGLPEDAKSLVMVLIPAGTFTMGSPADEQGRRDKNEWLPHEVTITEAFYLGKYEATQAQWKTVMGSNPALYNGKPNHPVEHVSWNDCQSFIEKLNTLENGTFRLPTEAEWEYACRAGTTTRFSFGDALVCPDLWDYCAMANEYMWWGGNDSFRSNVSGTKEIGLKLPNPWGLHDMHGNVWEWCSDGWERPYIRGPQVDPQGSEDGLFRRMRGGGWGSSAVQCRSAYGAGHVPDGRTSLMGLRLVREYESESTVESFTRY